MIVGRGECKAFYLVNSVFEILPYLPKAYQVTFKVKVKVIQGQIFHNGLNIRPQYCTNP